jgi:HEPN domain-containing protein
MKRSAREFVLSKNVASILWTKAQHDFLTAELLIDRDPRVIGDETFGFHLQQTVEKATKALLARHNIQFPFTHDLQSLFTLLNRHLESVPDEFRSLEILTPFASRLRYETPLGTEFLNRRELFDLVGSFAEWIASQLDL